MAYKFTKEFMTSKWFVICEDKVLRVITDVYPLERDGGISIEIDKDILFLNVLVKGGRSTLFRIRRLNATRGLTTEECFEYTNYVSYSIDQGWDTTKVRRELNPGTPPIPKEKVEVIIEHLRKQDPMEDPKKDPIPDIFKDLIKESPDPVVASEEVPVRKSNVNSLIKRLTKHKVGHIIPKNCSRKLSTFSK